MAQTGIATMRQNFFHQMQMPILSISFGSRVNLSSETLNVSPEFKLKSFMLYSSSLFTFDGSDFERLKKAGFGPWHGTRARHWVIRGWPHMFPL
jgi:hypothetical protein